ncbi:hypothetical protein M231_03545 [Tremella mesenterica]|uniref:Uncharacterized protein n=1 Tax=Tremella mesenterica TaxID=5217 RepID=A0A4Q1BMW4_TREME|nr:hypothetical protein M231_03545 [Tremella mesenterica]
MPALDPFSAASRPMISFDSQPSDPLRFADTFSFTSLDVIPSGDTCGSETHQNRNGATLIGGGNHLPYEQTSYDSRINHVSELSGTSGISGVSKSQSDISSTIQSHSENSEQISIKSSSRYPTTLLYLHGPRGISESSSSQRSQFENSHEPHTTSQIPDSHESRTTSQPSNNSQPHTTLLTRTKEINHSAVNDKGEVVTIRRRPLPKPKKRDHDTGLPTTFPDTMHAPLRRASYSSLGIRAVLNDQNVPHTLNDQILRGVRDRNDHVVLKGLDNSSGSSGPNDHNVLDGVNAPSGPSSLNIPSAPNVFISGKEEKLSNYSPRVDVKVGMRNFNTFVGGFNGKGVERGSDEWMSRQVALCVDGARGELMINDCDLPFLSPKISDLRNLVTLPSSFSPSTSTSTQPRSLIPPTSPLTQSLSRLPSNPIYSPNLSHLSPDPGISSSISFQPQQLSTNTHPSPFSANRSFSSFSRTTSAPASAPFFRSPPRTNLTYSPYSSPESSERTNSLLASPALIEGVVSDTIDHPGGDRTSGSGPGREGTRGNGVGETQNRSPSSSPINKRIFSRSKTGAVALSPPLGPPPAKDIAIYANKNRLTSLPTALFDITNLTTLSLRHNQLTTLPAAIGELRHLRELNIGNNPIVYLPSTILNLQHLETFSAAPNKFLIPPSPPSTASHPSTEVLSSHTKPSPPLPSSPNTPSIPSKYPDLHTLTITPTGRRLGPLIRHIHPINRLVDICLNILISPHKSSIPPLAQYDWSSSSGRHPLLDPETMHTYFPHISLSDIKRMLQSVKTASDRMERMGKKSVPKLYDTPLPDDAAENPWFYPCPNPDHDFSWDVSSNVGVSGMMGNTWGESVGFGSGVSGGMGGSGKMEERRKLFLHPAEERIEWRDLCGVKDVPLKWWGCSPGCLRFLEGEEGEGEEDVDWGLEGLEE